MSALVKLSEITPLVPTHVVGAFASGDPEIDDFLRKRASAEQVQGLSQVYVTVDEDNRVRAYFTLSPISVRIAPALLPRLGMAEVPYPAIGGYLLGRLGVDSSITGRGIGTALTMRAARIARNQARAAGGAFLAVDAKTETLVAWYARLGFVRLDPSRRRMVLPFSAAP